jgi:hypothetical protein
MKFAPKIKVIFKSKTRKIPYQFFKHLSLLKNNNKASLSLTKRRKIKA